MRRVAQVRRSVFRMNIVTGKKAVWMPQKSLVDRVSTVWPENCVVLKRRLTNVDNTSSLVASV